MEADVRDRSRIRSIGDVGADVVESVRNRLALGAAKFVDIGGKAPRLGGMVKGWLSSAKVRCGLDRIELG